MDEKDEVILKTVLSNSRTPLTHIAAELHISEAAVRKRIKKLEKVGAIRSYTAIIDPYYLGYEGVALVGIDARPENLLSVFEKVRDMPDIRYAALTSGDHMIMFEIWCRDSDELSKALDEIGNYEGVTRICPAIFVKRME